MPSQVILSTVPNSNEKLFSSSRSRRCASTKMPTPRTTHRHTTLKISHQSLKPSILLPPPEPFSNPPRKTTEPSSPSLPFHPSQNTLDWKYVNTRRKINAAEKESRARQTPILAQPKHSHPSRNSREPSSSTRGQNPEESWHQHSPGKIVCRERGRAFSWFEFRKSDGAESRVAPG